MPRKSVSTDRILVHHHAARRRRHDAHPPADHARRVQRRLHDTHHRPGDLFPQRRDERVRREARHEEGIVFWPAGAGRVGGVFVVVLVV